MTVKRGQEEFWSSLKTAIRAFAKFYVAQVRVDLGFDDEDLAQMAVEKVILHLDATRNEEWRNQFMSPEIAAEALAYAYTCVKNHVRSALRRAKVHDRVMGLSPHRISPQDGVLEISGRRSFNPEQEMIARDFIRLVTECVARKRAAQMKSALETIMDEAGNDVQSQDLTHLAGVSSNVLSFERRRLKKKLKNLGYNDWELNNEEKA
jgi:DNA-directed RNA polymerase specialized sigma24 family protein